MIQKHLWVSCKYWLINLYDKDDLICYLVKQMEAVQYLVDASGCKKAVVFIKGLLETKFNLTEEGIEKEVDQWNARVNFY